MDGAVREERTGIGRRARWLSLCVSITLAAGLAAGCRRAAPPPPPPAKDAVPAADAKAGGDKAGAGASAAGEKGAPAPGGDKKGEPAGDKGAAAAGAAGKPAPAAAAGAKGAGAKDTPFPSQAAGTAGAANPAPGATKPGAGAVQIVAAAAAVAQPPAPAGAKPAPKEEIPGVPAVSIPQPSRCPFRSEAKASFGSATKRTAPDPGAVKPGAGLGSKPGSRPGSKVGPENPFGPLFPLPVGPIKPPSGATPTVAGGAPRVVEPAPTPAQPSLQLTGVIDGQPLMAILQGEKAHYIVQEGDPVPGGYRVASISLQRVVLHGRDRSSTVLRLGGKSG